MTATKTLKMIREIDAKEPSMTPVARWRLAEQAFTVDGVLIIRNLFDPAAIAPAAMIASDRLDGVLDAVGPIDVGIPNGYAEIVHRAPGRYDLLTDLNVGGHRDLKVLIAALLGTRARRVWKGVLLTEPGGAEQAWHADGEHLFPDRPVHLPVHCLNVFLPLVDVTFSNGPTEFAPGSHRLTRLAGANAHTQDQDLLAAIGYESATVTPTLNRGDVVLFDYRIAHRGLAHHGDQRRPVLYETWAAPWFRDGVNFPDRTLPTGALPC